MVRATDYGPAGTQAAIQAAIDVVTSSGRGGVLVSEGEWILDKRTANSLLYINSSNITLQGEPGSVLRVTLPATSYCEMITIGPPLSQLVDPFRQPVLPLVGSYLTGTTSMKLASPTNVLVPGDYVLLRTGQTLSGSTMNPDGELNRVASINGDVVEWTWPTAKPYRQEFFLEGLSGVSSPEGSGSPALYGVTKVNALQNVAVRGLKLTADNPGYWGFGGGKMLDKYEQTDLVYDAPCAGLGSPGRRRWSKILRCHATTRGTGGRTFYHYAVDTCVTDCDVFENTGINEDGVCNLHLHEGSANVLAANNRIYSKNVVGDQHPCSVRARAYNHKILDNWFIGGGNTYGLYVDGTCSGGGEIDGNTLIGNFGEHIAIASPNWISGSRNNKPAKFYTPTNQVFSEVSR